MPFAHFEHPSKKNEAKKSLSKERKKRLEPEMKAIEAPQPVKKAPFVVR